MHSDSVVASASCVSGLPDATSATGKRRWWPTQPQDRAIFMLTDFTCHDESYMTALGSHSKAIAWTIEGGGRSEPVKIGLKIEKSMMGKAEIVVTEGEKFLFPTGGGNPASLTHDFVQRWNFCGEAAGMNETGLYEALIAPSEPEASSAMDAEDELQLPPPPQWYPCTLKRQLEDGNSFEVLVMMPDPNGGAVEVSRSPVNCADIREKTSQRRISIPWRFVKLEIPTQDPLKAALTSDRGEPIAKFFAMPTPAVNDTSARSSLTVRSDQYRTSVHIDTTAAAFAQFMAREVTRGEVQADRSSKSWGLRVGAFAEHTVLLERGASMSAFKLTIDGKRVAEATADDLGCAGGPWCLNFRFIGKNVLNFMVFETNQYGMVLGTQATVPQDTMVEHMCSVLLPSSFDLSTARLQIDGVEFEGLHPKVPMQAAGNHTVALEDLRKEYGIHVPYKVSEEHIAKDEPVMPKPYERHPPPPPPIHVSSASPTPIHMTNPNQPTTGISQWFTGLRGIWQACYGNLRVPSHDEAEQTLSSAELAQHYNENYQRQHGYGHHKSTSHASQGHQAPQAAGLSNARAPRQSSTDYASQPHLHESSGLRQPSADYASRGNNYYKQQQVRSRQPSMDHSMGYGQPLSDSMTGHRTTPPAPNCAYHRPDGTVVDFSSPAQYNPHPAMASSASHPQQRHTPSSSASGAHLSHLPAPPPQDTSTSPVHPAAYGNDLDLPPPPPPPPKPKKLQYGQESIQAQSQHSSHQANVMHSHGRSYAMQGGA